ncbi:hypothetical protein GW17_00013367 [Ensete ventricosum]|nr:hypothetical protein GW17_00013367 [Ensete ventricosum]
MNFLDAFLQRRQRGKGAVGHGQGPAGATGCGQGPCKGDRTRPGLLTRAVSLQGAALVDGQPTRARRGATPTKALPTGTTPARPRGVACGQGNRWQRTALPPAQRRRRRRNEGKG